MIYTASIKYSFIKLSLPVALPRFNDLIDCRTSSNDIGVSNSAKVGSFVLMFSLLKRSLSSSIVTLISSDKFLKYSKKSDTDIFSPRLSIYFEKNFQKSRGFIDFKDPISFILTFLK